MMRSRSTSASSSARSGIQSAGPPHPPHKPVRISTHDRTSLGPAPRADASAPVVRMLLLTDHDQGRETESTGERNNDFALARTAGLLIDAARDARECLDRIALVRKERAAVDERLRVVRRPL